MWFTDHYMVAFDIPGYVEMRITWAIFPEGITYYTPEVTALEVPFTQLGAGTGITLDVESHDTVNEVTINSQAVVAATLQIEHTVDDDEPTLNLWDSGGSNPLSAEATDRLVHTGLEQ